MNVQTLVRMANQIAHNTAAYPSEVAKVKVATHLSRYWEPRMLKDLYEYMEKDGSGIEPVVRDAALALKAR